MIGEWESTISYLLPESLTPPLLSFSYFHWTLWPQGFKYVTFSLEQKLIIGQRKPLIQSPSSRLNCGTYTAGKKKVKAHYTWRPDIVYLMLKSAVLFPGWVTPRSRRCTQWWASGWSPSSCPRFQQWAGTTLSTASTPLTADSLWLR